MHLLLFLSLFTTAHALFECVGTDTGACEDDAICCQDDARCYPFDAVASDQKLCAYSCTCTAGDDVCQTLKCYNKVKSTQLACFGKTCHSHGECAAGGTCYCDRGWGGDDCENIECINNCNGEDHGKCVAGVCKCKENWIGDDCSNPVCPEGCSGHGNCNCTDKQCTCTCAFQWRGAGCGEPGCPSSTAAPCSGHGECQREGENPYDESKKFGCRCDTGWTGVDCGEQTCFRDCMNRGECRNGICVCKATHSGEGCQHRNLCGPDCERYAQKYGKCNSDQNKCMCEQGWEGFDCLFKTPTPADCLSGAAKKLQLEEKQQKGQVSSSLLLSMTETLQKTQSKLKRSMQRKLEQSDEPTAQQIALAQDTSQEVQVGCGEEVRDRDGAVSDDGECPNACTDPDRGVCMKGECVCKPGYSGPACAGRQCPNGCSGNGLCDPTTGLCTCDTGATGIDCGALNCLPYENPCTNHGECREGKCICEPPFVGAQCQSKVCPVGRGKLECSGDGMCGEDGACHCPPGRGGLACEKDVCLNDCMGVGLCKNDACFCPEGRSGEDCSRIDCPIKGCSGHGLCDFTKGVCTCDQGYSGTGCEGSICEGDCGSNGQCNVETKKCECTEDDRVVACDKVDSFKRTQTTLRTAAKNKMSLTACATGCSDKCAKGSVAKLTTCNVQCTKQCLSTGVI
jgi:hypothetical protein